MGLHWSYVSASYLGRKPVGKYSLAFSPAFIVEVFAGSNEQYQVNLPLCHHQVLEQHKTWVHYLDWFEGVANNILSENVSWPRIWHPDYMPTELNSYFTVKPVAIGYT